MRQKFFIVLGLLILIAGLIGLNALSYTQKEKVPDNEFSPNRSTYNLGATGTRAFFDLLNESGRRAVRWEQPPSELRGAGKNAPGTLVIVGKTRREIGELEAKQILDWVASSGAKLVIVDRGPSLELLRSDTAWSMLVEQNVEGGYGLDGGDPAAMTKGIDAGGAAQPTALMNGVGAIQPSRLASSIRVNFDKTFAENNVVAPYREEAEPPRVKTTPSPASSGRASEPVPTLTPTRTPRPKPTTMRFATPTPGEDDDGDAASEDRYDLAPDEGNGQGIGIGSSDETLSAPPIVAKTPASPPAFQRAPVVHAVSKAGNIVVDVPHGQGRIVIVSDPFMISNGGVALADNAQLLMNVVATSSGPIAFDEYHQGYGASGSRLLERLEGTPVLPFAFQLVALIGLLFYSQSRRFARAVPEPEPSRLSKLEYVAAMAELQRRTKGYDLAIENIFGDFRRRAARLVGVDAQRTRPRDFAMLIADRLPDESADDIERLFARCLDVMHGDESGKKEVLALTARIRDLEAKLGLQRRKKGRS